MRRKGLLMALTVALAVSGYSARLAGQSLFGGNLLQELIVE